MIRFFSLALLFLTFAAVQDAQAASVIYGIDPAHTRVEYRISHLGFSSFMGAFSDVRGQIDFDPEHPENAAVKAQINASSVTMLNGALDAKLKSASFFNVAKYPVISFVSTDIDRTGSSSGTMTGKLTLLGVTKPVTLQVEFSKRAWNKYAGAYAVGFTATTKIHRSDFGMKYLLPDVGDDVTIRIDVEAVQGKPSELDSAAQVKEITSPKAPKEETETAEDKSPPPEGTDKKADAEEAAPQPASPPAAKATVPPTVRPPVSTPNTPPGGGKRKMMF